MGRTDPARTLKGGLGCFETATSLLWAIGVSGTKLRFDTPEGELELEFETEAQAEEWAAALNQEAAGAPMQQTRAPMW